jgi:hypothetical protein
MQEQTIYRTVELPNTTYTCDQEGCDFTTITKYEADSHYGKKHSIAEVGEAGGATLYRFASKEDFDAYCKAQGIGERHFHWDEPGWYRTFWKEDRRGCSCCYDNYEHLHPACWIAFDWQKKIKGTRERLAEMAEFLDDETLLEFD